MKNELKNLFRADWRFYAFRISLPAIKDVDEEIVQTFLGRKSVEL